MLISQRVRQKQMLSSYYGPDTSLLLHPHSSIATRISVVSWYFSLTHIFTTSPIFSVNVHCGQHLPTYLLLYFFFISLPSSILYVVFENTNNSLSVDWTIKGYTPCGGLLGDRTCSGIRYNVVRPGVSAYHILSNHYFVNTMQH